LFTDCSLNVQEQELKAARSKNYKVADSLTAAVKQIDEVMVRYKELMQVLGTFSQL
jgi:hypothetical protein